MPAIGALALAVGAAVFIVRATLRQAFAALIAITLLVPSTLVIPNGFTSYLTVERITVGAFIVSLVLRRHRGELPAGAFRGTRVHIVMAVFASIALLNGVALAVATTGTSQAFAEWSKIADQFIFFAVVLVAIRAINDPWWIARLLATIGGAMALIALYEHWRHWSWSRWFFSGLGLNGEPAIPLEVRNGVRRVRVASEFALQFAWVGTMLLAFVIAVADITRRRIWLIFIGVLGVAIYWSYSRSSGAGIVLVFLIILLASGFDRRVATMTLIIVLAVGTVYVAKPSLGDPYHGQSGSTASRGDHARVVAALAADRPYQGVGLSGLTPFEIPTTDNSYERTYGEIGVVGLTTLIILLFTAAFAAAGSLRAPPGRDRVIAGAALAGFAAGIVGAAAFDFISLGQSAHLLWLCVALGIAIGERYSTEPTSLLPRLTTWRFMLIVVGAAGGIAIGSIVPRHAAVVYRFETLPATTLAVATYNPVWVGDVMVHTACGSIDAIASEMPSAKVECRDLHSFRGQGVGELRVQARTKGEVTAVVDRLNERLQARNPVFQLDPVTPLRTAPPTWALTARAWLLEVSIAIAFLTPSRQRRKTRDRQQDPRIRSDVPAFH
jgi:hypothetical protein